ncbi:MAG TPA: hypothetical protein VIU44_12970, partial [Gaiellaceae bacterium]
MRPVPPHLRIPGFVNAHAHTFQRALRGRAGGGDFWAWRDGMLAEAERQTPESVRREYAESYAEMRAAGYTAVGEWIREGPERRLDVPAPRQPAVDLVGDAGDAEDDRRRPARAAVRGEDQRDEDGDQGQAPDRQRVRQLGERCGDCARGHDGRICGRCRLTSGSRASSTPTRTPSSAR